MILGNLLGNTRSLENPSVPLSAIERDSDLWTTLTGGESALSGVRVSRKSALSDSAIWRAVNLITRDVAKIPMHLFRRTEDGGKERAVEHPVYALARRRPNVYMKAFDFKQTLLGHVLLHGNAYAYIFRRGDGVPLELLPLVPTSTYPIRVDGVLWYITTVGKTGELRRLRPEDVIHVRGLGFDGLIGYDVLSVAKSVFGLSLALRQFGELFFRNGAHPTVIIEHPGSLKPDAFNRLRESWEKMHSGLENMHKTAILEEGMKANVLGVDARKAQLSEMRDFELREVANIMGVPPHKVGASGGRSYASIEQENQSYVQEALDPWFCQFEDEFSDKLLTEEEKAADSHFFEFNRNALVRADLSSRVNAYGRAILDGWMNRDEVRAAENLNPIPDGAGKKFYVPLNMTLAGEQPGDASGQRAAIAHLNEALLTAISRVHARISDQALKAARAPESFETWLTGLDARSIERPLLPMVRALHALIGLEKPILPGCLYVDAARAQLRALAGGSKPASLVGDVEAWTRSSAVELPPRLAAAICQ